MIYIYPKPLPRLELAVAYSTAMHAGQRDLQGQPYIYHPLRVMEVAREIGLDEDHQIIAGLHDVEEDTEATYETVHRLFGTDIADDVHALSRQEVDGKTERYFDFIDRVCLRPRARRIKLLDIADNMLPSRYVPELSGLEGRYKKARAKIGEAILAEPEMIDYWLLAQVGAFSHLNFSERGVTFERTPGWFNVK
jgi:guanosine-3',5'-bis(diphosphate) 3'-pyrophosphohydrolase